MWNPPPSGNVYGLDVMRISSWLLSFLLGTCELDEELHLSALRDFYIFSWVPVMKRLSCNRIVKHMSDSKNAGAKDKEEAATLQPKY